MKTMIALVALSFISCGAFAADKEKKAPSPAQQAQQAKMNRCPRIPLPRQSGSRSKPLGEAVQPGGGSSGRFGFART